mmetsp:Transcript_55409/g.101697  ORF Transcript_55409/g.101697 Transcript_55409/m.101697 type:complete len:123 (+) Transcript_55409:19-387(+)
MTYLASGAWTGNNGLLDWTATGTQTSSHSSSKNTRGTATGTMTRKSQASINGPARSSIFTRACHVAVQNLKENDIPGIRRLDWQQRVARLDRDRNTDELSQLIQKHTRNSNGNNDEEEPGVD